jgi:UDP-glucuronate decarboxylase
MNKIVFEDLKNIHDSITNKKHMFENSNIFITGCAGFLGYYFMSFFDKYKNDLKINSIVGVDNFRVGNPHWLNDIIENGNINVQEFDIIKEDLAKINLKKDNSFIIHMASIASPTFYRKYPIETIEANVFGLKRLMDTYKKNSVRGFLFFSSSEIYGDPTQNNIPTSETYKGNVATIGPRSCYDEAKRFGETLCFEYSNQYNLPIRIVRPFNNYGPGMKLGDKRVPADFAKAIVNNEDIVILSDGKPTRTYCYIADAISGYLKALLHDEFDVFNIGINKPEISVSKLAEIYAEAGKDVFGYNSSIIYKISQEKDYLTDNPNRRCPVITKAKEKLDYNPKIYVEDGVKRFLEFIKYEGIKQ